MSSITIIPSIHHVVNGHRKLPWIGKEKSDLLSRTLPAVKACATIGKDFDTMTYKVFVYVKQGGARICPDAVSYAIRELPQAITYPTPIERPVVAGSPTCSGLRSTGTAPLPAGTSVPDASREAKSAALSKASLASGCGPNLISLNSSVHR